MKKVLLTFASIALVASIYSCRETTEEKTEDAMESAAEDTENNMEEAGEAVENAGEEMNQEVQAEVNETDEMPNEN